MRADYCADSAATFQKEILARARERERESRKVESAFLDYFYCDLFKGYKKTRKMYDQKNIANWLAVSSEN